MSRFDGTLARTLDFGQTTTAVGGGARAGLRLALRGGLLRGPDKYKVLERRRRRAQMRARRALDLIEIMERQTVREERS
jgi:hypothetical protein